MLKFYFEDEEMETIDINTMCYHDFLQHEIVLYIDTVQSTKQLRNFRKKVEAKSFYPIHIIFISINDTKESKENKLKQSQKKNEDKFKMRYCQVAKKQFGVESLFLIRDQIKKYPFCHKNMFSIVHDYSLDNTSNCFLSFQCNSCNQVLDRESSICVMDAYYDYNPVVHRYMDEYCQHYGDKILLQKLYDELDNTEMTGYCSDYIKNILLRGGK